MAGRDTTATTDPYQASSMKEAHPMIAVRDGYALSGGVPVADFSKRYLKRIANGTTKNFVMLSMIDLDGKSTVGRPDFCRISFASA